jgi:TP901 family phage tail tape measure protein
MDGLLAVGLVLSLVDKFTGPMGKAEDILERLEGKAKGLGRVKILPDIDGVMRSWKALQTGGPNIEKAKAYVKVLQQAREQSDRLTEMGSKATGAGAMMMAGGIGMARQLEATTKPLGDIEERLAYIKTITPGTFGSAEADVAKFRRAAIDWSNAHRDSATQFLDSSYMMLSAGLDAEKALFGTELGMKFALATKGDAVPATDLLTDAYNNFGDKTRDVRFEQTRLADVLARTQQLFKLADLGQLSGGLQYGIPAGLAAQQNLVEVAGAIGMLNNLALKGTMAGTAYSAMMKQMEEASTKLHFSVQRNAAGGVDLLPTLRNLRAMYGDKMNLPKTKAAFQDAFGDEGGRAVTVLLGKLDEFEAGLKDISKAAGSVETAFAIIDQQKNIRDASRENALSNMKAALGQGVLPSSEAIGDAGQSAAKWVANLTEGHPILAKVVGTLGQIIAYGGTLAGVLTAGVGGALLVAGVRSKFLTLLMEHGMGRSAGALRVVESGVWKLVTGPFKALGASLKWIFTTGVPRAIAGLKAMDAVSMASLLAKFAIIGGVLAAFAALSYVLWKKSQEHPAKTPGQASPLLTAGSGVSRSRMSDDPDWMMKQLGQTPTRSVQSNRAMNVAGWVPEWVLNLAGERRGADGTAQKMNVTVDADLSWMRDAVQRQQQPSGPRVNIQNLNVSPADATDEEAFLKMLNGLGMEH